jgi:hypothetical protein
MLRKSACLVAAALIASVATPATAATGVVSFTLGSSFTGFSTDETVGFVFSSANNIAVTALGWWDADTSNPLNASHQVGIWNSAGTLLGSVTVNPNDPLNGDFRYAGLPVINLLAGQQYFIGGRDLVGDGDNYASSNTALVMGSGITFVGAARTDAGAGFAFPSIVTTNSGGRFGPNFDYRILNAAVPEPGSWLMMIAGFGFVGGAMRSRRRVAVRFTAA